MLCVVAMAGSASAQGVPAGESRPLGGGVRAVAAPAKASTTPASLGGTVLKTVVSLGGVLAVIGVLGLGVRHLAKKGVLPASLGTGARAPSGLLDVLARYPAGAGQTLLVLKFDRRVLLVCQSPGRGLRKGGGTMTPICELSEPQDVASVLLKVRGEEQAAMARTFQAMLTQEDGVAERVVSGRALPAGRSGAVPAPQARAHERPARVRSAAQPTKPAIVQHGTGREAAVAIRARLASMREQPANPAALRAAIRAGEITA